MRWAPLASACRAMSACTMLRAPSLATALSRSVEVQREGLGLVGRPAPHSRRQEAWGNAPNASRTPAERHLQFYTERGTSLRHTSTRTAPAAPPASLCVCALEGATLGYYLGSVFLFGRCGGALRVRCSMPLSSWICTVNSFTYRSGRF